MSEQTETKKEKGAIEVFMGGARKGLYIGLEQILPAMILGYVIVEFLKLTGIIGILRLFWAGNGYFWVARRISGSVAVGIFAKPRYRNCC